MDQPARGRGQRYPQEVHRHHHGRVGVRIALAMQYCENVPQTAITMIQPHTSADGHVQR